MSLRVSSVHFTASDPRVLIDAVKAAGAKRYLVVGGAGSLEVAPGVKLIDTPEFPDAYKPEAAKGGEFLELLRKEKELDWTLPLTLRLIPRLAHAPANSA
jgi:uncharacterized protein